MKDRARVRCGCVVEFDPDQILRLARAGMTRNLPVTVILQCRTHERESRE